MFVLVLNGAQRSPLSSTVWTNRQSHPKFPPVFEPEVDVLGCPKQLEPQF